MISAFVFLLTRLLRGVTDDNQTIAHFGDISTHTPLARRDRSTARNMKQPAAFLLTRLLRGVTPGISGLKPWYIIFLLTRLLRGVTVQPTGAHDAYNISTHTPLARRDSTADE